MNHPKENQNHYINRLIPISNEINLFNKQGYDDNIHDINHFRLHGSSELYFPIAPSYSLLLPRRDFYVLLMNLS